MIVCVGGDHEFSIFDSIEDHAGFGPGPDCELHEANLVVMLNGHRGHYLGRDFIYEAIYLLELDDVDPGTDGDRKILDRYEDEPDGEVEEGSGFTVAECVSEMIGEYEEHLDHAGYLTEWNDGVVIVKVGEQINE